MRPGFANRSEWKPFEWRRDTLGENPGLEPVAAIGHPPAHTADGNGRGQGPPKWQKKICRQTQNTERNPKNPSLHWLILTPGEEERAVVQDRLQEVDTA